MKRIILAFFLVLLLLPVSGFARENDIGFGRDDCPETKVTRIAIEVRQSRAEAIYSQMIDDPEADRDVLGSCLETINILGDPYSMGVRLPGLDQIIEALCDALNAEISEKFRKVKSLADNPDFGFMDAFRVNTNPDMIANELLRQLRSGKL